MKIKNLEDIKKDAYLEEDPEVAIEKAIINTCCLIREKIYKEVLDPLRGNNIMILVLLNQPVDIIRDLEYEAGFKTKSWRASK